MSIEFAPEDVSRWPHGDQMADVYERSMRVARQLPERSLQRFSVSAGADRPSVDFVFSALCYGDQYARRICGDAEELSKDHLSDCSVSLKTHMPEDLKAATQDTSDLPQMREDVWPRVQRHADYVGLLAMPVRLVETQFHAPLHSRSQKNSNLTYPSVYTRVEAAFTSGEERLQLYEWARTYGIEHTGGLGAYAFTLALLDFKKGDWNPDKIDFKVFDCTPGGWLSYETEKADWEAEKFRELAFFIASMRQWMSNLSPSAKTRSR